MSLSTIGTRTASSFVGARHATRATRRARLATAIPYTDLTHRRVALGGIQVDALTEAQVVATVMSRLDGGRGGHLVTPNASMLRLCRRELEKRLIEDADLVVSDGMPLVWAARLQGTPLPERVTGSSLIWSLSRSAAARGRSVYLLGGMEHAAETAAQRLTSAVPGLRVAGSLCPAFGFENDAEQMDLIIEAVVATEPDIVFVGLGFPKQEVVAVQLRAHLPSTWFVGCGAAINFAAGLQRRAPRWMQKSGLEWIHRLLAEPARLGPRYAADAVFAAGLLCQAASARRR